MSPNRKNFTDVEGLLAEESEEAQVKTHSRSGRLIGAAGSLIAVGIMGSIAVTAMPQQLRSSDVSAVVGLDSVPDNCFKQGMYFAGPIKMEGQDKTLEADAKGCQARCAGVEECAHFTFWPDGGCLLTSNTSHLKSAPVTYSAAIVGPASCDEVAAYESTSSGTSFCDGPAVMEGPSLGPSACSMSCDDHKDCKYYSIWHTGGQNWCRLTSNCDFLGEQSNHNITIYKKNSHQHLQSEEVHHSMETAAVGTNGTECSAYPACVAVNIASGSCCPNSEGVALGCCNGFPKPIVATVVAAGTECAAFPGCKALNLTQGGCCPTADGTRLGCCDA